MDRQREAIPNLGTNHCKGTFLPGGGACKWYTEKTLIGGTEGARAPCTLYGATELNKIGRSKAQQTTSYQCSHPIFYSLLSRKPVQDVAHIDRDVVIFGYATNETSCRAQNAIQAAYPGSRKASVETATIVKPGSDETVNKSSSSSGSKRAGNSAQLAELII